MESKTPLVRKLAVFLLYALAVAFSIKSLREPDLWWQIRTGEWILANGKVPMQDVFSFTREGMRWINIKWLAEVFAALATKFAGPESVVLLQAIVSGLVVFFLLQWTKLLGHAGRGATTIALLLLIPLLIGSEYRMTGRPEMYSHLLSVVFCYLYTRHFFKHDKWIWLIVPLQLLWANLHEAFAIGIVISGIFTAATVLGVLLQKKAWQLSAVYFAITLASIAAITINPNGMELLLRPFAILGQLESNKYTTELLSISNHLYWQKEAWIAIAFLAPVIIFCALYVQKHKLAFLKQEVLSLVIANLLLCIAFAYLAASAYRNIVLLLLVVFPLLAYVLGQWIEELLVKHPKLEFRMLLFTIGTASTLYVLVVSNQWYTFIKSRDNFGMEVLSVNNPCGAAQFLKQQQVKGKIFSDYLTSSYLLWKLQPNFKTFIDLRDLDVFTDTSFNEFGAMVQIPQVFEAKDSVEHFNAIVLYRPEFATLHRYLYNSKKWRAVYADAVAVVYLRDTTAPQLNFTKAEKIQVSGLCFAINKLLNPLYSGFDPAAFDYHKLAASYFQSVNDYDKALAEINLSITGGITPDETYSILGDIYYTRALNATQPTNRTNDLQSAFQAYQTALAKNEKNALAHLGLGAVYFQNGNFRAAAEQFEDGIKANPNELNLHLFAAQAYSQLMVVDKNANAMVLKRYKSANELNPNNPVILLNIATAAYRASDFKEACVYANRVKEVPDFSKEEKQAIQTILANCERE